MPIENDLTSEIDHTLGIIQDTGNIIQNLDITKFKIEQRKDPTLLPLIETIDVKNQKNHKNI